MVNVFFEQRIFWLEQMSRYLREDIRDEVLTKLEKKNTLFYNYLDKIDKLGDSDGDFKGRLTQFFNLTNGFRNAGNKELNQVENFIHLSFKHSELAKNPDLKKSINKDFVQAKKAFSDQDQKLRKRMSEILNASKNR